MIPVLAGALTLLCLAALVYVFITDVRPPRLCPECEKPIDYDWFCLTCGADKLCEHCYLRHEEKHGT